jgi:hypothetical protein
MTTKIVYEIIKAPKGYKGKCPKCGTFMVAGTSAKALDPQLPDQSYDRCPNCDCVILGW